ncbi:MAG: hypothetical protein FMNOHCHN_03749 [Ignavibacteriaceae bacterium]|nr:hypothetical protein [Ignavibacteriaceae bacterium]
MSQQLGSLKKDIAHIKRNISSLEKVLISIDKTLALQQKSLDEHIRRTELLEQQVEPIKTHVNRVEGITKFILALAALAAGVGALLVLT